MLRSVRELKEKAGKQPRRSGRRKSDAHRRELEKEIRIFLDYAKRHPNHLFASGTQRFIKHVCPIIEQMDALEKPVGAEK